jgi:hypothetical protein
MKQDQTAPLIEGLQRALFLLLDSIEGQVDGDALLEHARPAIAAVKIALHREQRRRAAANPARTAFAIQPVRIQYVRGQRMGSPNGLKCIYVGRPTSFGNPYRVGANNTPTRKEAVDAFRAYVLSRPTLIQKVKAELRGKNLACWCPCDGQPCHADVLLQIANT